MTVALLAKKFLGYHGTGVSSVIFGEPSTGACNPYPISHIPSAPAPPKWFPKYSCLTGLKSATCLVHPIFLHFIVLTIHDAEY
jgi:hypothetical protein